MGPQDHSETETAGITEHRKEWPICCNGQQRHFLSQVIALG